MLPVEHTLSTEKRGEANIHRTNDTLIATHSVRESKGRVGTSVCNSPIRPPSPVSVFNFVWAHGKVLKEVRLDGNGVCPRCCERGPGGAYRETSDIRGHKYPQSSALAASPTPRRTTQTYNVCYVFGIFRYWDMSISGKTLTYSSQSSWFRSKHFQRI